MTLDEFLAWAWEGYAQLTPDAPIVHRALSERGERISNDHVAVRTFNLAGISRFELGSVFEVWGYTRSPDDLDFVEKKLKASYWLPPSPDYPKIFISELLLEKVTPGLREWILSFAAPLAARAAGRGAQLLLEQSWEPVSFADYEKFYAESEYAAWTAAFGIRVNHFTVFVNGLRTFAGLEELNAFLLTQGIKLSAAGGLIKGTPSELLEQTSTQARPVPCRFAGGEAQSALGCYYEFARRYPLPGGTALFEGFIPSSANRIFESTSRSS